MRKIIITLMTTAVIGGLAYAQGPYNPQGLSWTANTETDLAGYYIYEANTSGGHTQPNFAFSVPAGTEQFTFSAHDDGHFFTVITAYDHAGNESGFSNEVEYTFDTQGCAAPQNLRVIE